MKLFLAEKKQTKLKLKILIIKLILLKTKLFIQKLNYHSKELFLIKLIIHGLLIINQKKKFLY